MVVGALTVATIVVPSGGAIVLASDCVTFASGIIFSGEVDDTRAENPACAVVACTDALRPAAVTVSFLPQSEFDLLLVQVQFASGTQTSFLNAVTPSQTFVGLAPDGCLTPVLLVGVVVTGLAPYTEQDESLPL